MEPLTIENTIEINATAARVWDVLTKPELTKVYMFGCETVSDWTVGSELLWRGRHDGAEMVFVKGRVISIDPPHKLVYSTFDPYSTLPDIAENYLDVTYYLTEASGLTTLTVIQGDYNTVADGERRYKAGYNDGEGWNPILVEMKKLAESENLAV